MRKIVAIFIFCISLNAQSDYELGEGVQISSLPLYLGGYFSIDYKKKDNEDRYRIDDIAMLSYGAYDKISYMLELEYKEFYVKTFNDEITTTQQDKHLYIERMYVDYNLDDNYIFKIGKYNSPIGFWNLLPINVLRETSSSPMSSTIIFPKFTTGISSSYSSYNEGELKIDLMFQNNKDIDDDYNNYEITELYGFGISYEIDDIAIKANIGAFGSETEDSYAESENQNYLYYGLLSAKYEAENYQLLTEVGSQRSSSEITTAYAGFIQGLYRFTPKHIGIVRVESYDDKANALADEMGIFGYTYRPSYPVAIKSEYQFHLHDDNNQFLFSLSVLF